MGFFLCVCFYSPLKPQGYKSLTPKLEWHFYELLCAHAHNDNETVWDLKANRIKIGQKIEMLKIND